MDTDEFVQAIKITVSDSAVESVISTLEKPIGRRPDPKAVKRSEWYKQLSAQDQAMVREVILQSSEMAVFGFCCVLDGVRAIEDVGEKGSLELYFVKNGEKTFLNNPQNEELHNLYNWYTRDQFLKSK